MYATVPSFFRDEVQVFRRSIPPTVFVLLLPITDDEAEFIGTQGWEPFEDLLETTDVDLFDLYRHSSLNNS